MERKNKTPPCIQRNKDEDEKLFYISYPHCELEDSGVTSLKY